MIRQKNLFFKSIGYSVALIFKSSKLMILLYLLSNILQSTLTLLSTFILKYVLDSLTDADPQINLIFGWVGLYALSLVVIQANMSVQNILYDSVFKKAENQYECNLARKLAELPLSVIDSSEGKDMVDDVRHAKNTAVYTTYRMVSIVSRLYTFIVAFITLIKFNVWFSFLFLSLTVPGIILNKKFDKKAENLRREKAPDVRKFSYYRWMLTDSWPAKDVRMYDLTNPIKARYDEEKKQYLSANKRLDKQKVGSLLLAETIRRSGETVFIIFVVYQAINGMISIGDIALYIGFALTTSNSFNSIVLNLIIGYTRATTVMGRVFDFFTIHTERSCGSRSIERFDSLSFDNVYFKYPHTEKYVLSGVSFTLKGDCAVLLDWNIPFQTALDMMKDVDVHTCYIEKKYLNQTETILPSDIEFFTYENSWKGIPKFLPNEIYRKFQNNDSRDEAVVIYSSGTTGTCKGIVLSHYAIHTNAETIMDYMKPTAKDCIYICKPLSHSSMLVGELLVALKSGMSLVIAPIIVPPRYRVKS